MTQEALRMAHKALIGLSIKHGEMTDEGMDAITAIEKALAKEKALQALHSENERLGLYKDAYAQPEQEPVADDFFRMIADRNPKPFPLPQRTWVGLEGEEIRSLWEEATKPDRSTMTMVTSFARAIEAKLKERNDHSI